jgi:hypothetical protein
MRRAFRAVINLSVGGLPGWRWSSLFGLLRSEYIGCASVGLGGMGRGTYTSGNHFLTLDIPSLDPLEQLDE